MLFGCKEIGRSQMLITLIIIGIDGFYICLEFYIFHVFKIHHLHSLPLLQKL